MDDKLRVLFSIGSLAGGGAERQTLQYLQHLDRRRFEPLLYVTYRRGELLNAVPSDVETVAFWDRHPYPRWNLPGRIHRRQTRDLANILNERHIDALVAVTFPSVLVAGSAIQKRPTPWLAVEMADPRKDLANEVKRYRWLKQRLLTKAYRRASYCVAVSEGVRDGLVELYHPAAQRLVVVPNFVDLEEIDRRSAEPSPRLHPDRFHLVAVGRLNRQKGHIYLLEALNTLVNRLQRSNLHLHLIGQGPLEPELRKYVRSHKLDAYVTFVGYLENPLPFVRQSQLFCLPSLYEGLPLALLEAMACETPVIAADCPSGPAEVLAQGRFGQLVPPCDAHALADSIRAAMDNPDSLREICVLARQQVKDRYSAPVVIDRFQRLIERAASERRPFSGRVG